MQKQIYSPQGSKVRIYDEQGNFIQNKTFDQLEIVDKVGLICYYIAKGMSLSEVATGEGWRPQQQIYRAWLRNDKELALMHKKAEKDREKNIMEELIKAKNADDKPKVDLLVSTLKAFNKKIVKNILPPPVVIKRSDWRHEYEQKWKQGVPTIEDIHKEKRKPETERQSAINTSVEFKDMKEELMDPANY